MNKKTIAIILLITVILAFSLFQILSTDSVVPIEDDVFFDSTAVAEPENVDNNIGQSAVSVSTRSGNDFLLDDDVKTWYGDEDTFLLDENITPDGPLFQTFYFEFDDSITISLQTEPLLLARSMAEEALLARLNLSKEVICTLKINVTVPAQVNEQYSGINLGLSFCPNSIPL